MKVNAYDPKKDKKVFAGVYLTDKSIFIKTVSQKNFMIVEDGYGIQWEVMKQLKEWGCKEIHIKLNKEVYEVNFETWYENGNIKNYGHGKQSFFKLKGMWKK